MKLLFLVIVCTFGVVLTINVSAQPLKTEKSTLGKKLFFDKRLSEDGTVSCASCHDPASAFASGDAVAIGVREQKGTRNAPTLLNSKFSRTYFWDGRVATLEEQAKQPLLNPSEMGMLNEAALVERISAIDEYRKSFQRVFPREGITIDTITIAIAAFERTLVSDNSPFDRFIRGDRNAISAAQKRGWELFKGKAGCIECHSFSSASPFFTDFKFYNTGMGFTEPGRYLVTKDSKDIGAFKTPTLRDVELTRPYMHNGSINTLLDVVRFYNQGGEKNSNLDEKLRPLDLTDEEMSELVEFMRALTSDAVLRQVQSSKPQNRNPVLFSREGVKKIVTSN
jgi:cytochrome c peroxidase